MWPVWGGGFAYCVVERLFRNFYHSENHIGAHGRHSFEVHKFNTGFVL
jgi:hypothetical protein